MNIEARIEEKLERVLVPSQDRRWRQVIGTESGMSDGGPRID